MEPSESADDSVLQDCLDRMKAGGSETVIQTPALSVTISGARPNSIRTCGDQVRPLSEEFADMVPALLKSQTATQFPRPSPATDGRSSGKLSTAASLLSVRVGPDETSAVKKPARNCSRMRATPLRAR